MLSGKHIIVGITGGIAAYKAAVLVRLLVRRGAEVQVLMTKAAKEFITPLTMATLSKRPILVENFNPENGAWNSHIDLGCWADAMVIAPATANTLAKMAGGIGDSLLSVGALSDCRRSRYGPRYDGTSCHHAKLANPRTTRCSNHRSGVG